MLLHMGTSHSELRLGWSASKRAAGKPWEGGSSHRTAPHRTALHRTGQARPGGERGERRLPAQAQPSRSRSLPREPTTLTIK